MKRRVVSVWFPRLASDRALRARPVDAPFALSLKTGTAERIQCLNDLAEAAGLSRGMGMADARAFCPDLVSRPARPQEDAGFLRVLARWATRYCPWVGLDGADGLALDVTGAAHLFGGEAAMLDDMRLRLMRSGFAVRLGLADTKGAAWALARYGEGIAPAGQTRTHLMPLPVAALRLEPEICTRLQRLGLRAVGDLLDLPRATLTRRFGPGLLMRLDQALGAQPEEVSPLVEPPDFSARMTLAEP